MTHNTEKLLNVLAELNCTVEKTKYGAIIITPSVKREREETKEEPCFKDGDFISTIIGGEEFIGILKAREGDNHLHEYVYFECATKQIHVPTSISRFNHIAHATEEEKKLLLDALHKERKIWNAETLRLEDDKEPRVGDTCVFWDNGDLHSVRVTVLQEAKDGIPQYVATNGWCYDNCIRFEDFDFERMKPKQLKDGEKE